MFMVAAMTDHVTGIVEQRASFEQHARFRRQMVNGLQLIKKQDAKLAHVFGVTLIVFQAACEAARANQELTRRGAVAMRLLARKSLARDFLKQPFANADAGDREGAQVEVAAEGDKSDRRDGHDVGTVAAHRVGLHALADIAAQDVVETLPQEGELQSRNAVLARTWCNGHERFRVAAKRDSNAFAEVWPRRQA